MVADDVRTGRFGRPVMTRFPPEPNGYLHIGHAKSICLNFGIAEEFSGLCNLRFDDTNPTTEDVEFTQAIQEDVRWLGFDWGDRLYHASDYFERLYDYAVVLIRNGRAYVDSLSEEEIREFRGTVKTPGRNSPWRDRSVEENLDLFARMRAGEFPDGAHVLRARIDMDAPNMLMRDPLLYRIRHAHHYRRGDAWCIYPMYDFAHCLSDAIEGVTHSLCTLEFKDNRELYNWVVTEVGIPAPPEQTEFARLNLDYTVLSKRRLMTLVKDGHVGGWDDPRMPTLAGLRRRGVPPTAVRRFCDMIGVARVDSRVDLEKLEFVIRDELNPVVPRVMAVCRPLRVVIVNYPEDRVEQLDAPLFPRDVPREGSRPVPFSRELYIERDDFSLDPPKGFHRLAPGREVRLRYAYLIRCVDVVTDSVSGEVSEVHCTYDPESRGGHAPDGRKVRGTLHWVSVGHALPAEIRLYDRLFRVPDPEAHDVPLEEVLNPESLVVCQGKVEPAIGDAPPGSRYQFERQGYFVSDPVDARPGHLVYNRTVTLRDSWKGGAGSGRGDRARTRRSRSTGARTRSGSRSPRVVAEADRSPELMRRREHYVQALKVPVAEAERLTRSIALAELFEATCAVFDQPPVVARWIVNDVAAGLKSLEPEAWTVTGEQLGRLLAMVESGRVSRSAAKEVLAELLVRGGDPEEIVRGRGLDTVVDGADLVPLVEDVLARFPDRVEAYRQGRTGLKGFFTGQVMRASSGRANPVTVRQLLDERLD